MPTANTQDLLKEIKPYVLGWTTSQYSSLLALNKFQQLPMLRGLWLMNSINENGSVYDASGQGRTLTNNNAAQFLQLPVTFQNYVALDGVNQYLSRADEAGLDITGALTFGGWFRVPAYPAANSKLIGKEASGQQSYQILLSTAGAAIFQVSSDGSTIANVSTGAIGYYWNFIAARFTPSTELAIWLNGTKYNSVVGTIPAALHSGTTEFNFGRRYGIANYLQMDATLCFLCAGLVSDEQIQYLYEG